MYHTALVLHKTWEKQDTYTVRQVEPRQCPSLASFSQSKTRNPVEVSLDALFHISGWIDTQTSEMMIWVRIGGHDLGVFHGMAKNTLRIDLHLDFVRGSIRLELNAFDELWVHVNTVEAGINERFAISGYKRSEQLQRLPGLVCEPWL